MKRFPLLLPGACFALCLVVGVTVGALSCSNSNSNPSPDASANSNPSCPNGFSTCNGQCTATPYDPANCGGCGVACPTGQLCQNGACSAASCMMGFSACGGGCVDFTKDVNNCGSCGKVCPDGQRCAASMCVDSCPSGTSACPPSGAATYCTNLQTDLQNCGACGKTCSPEQVCIAGVCQCDYTSVTAARLATCTMQGNGVVRCGGSFGFPVNRFVPVQISSVMALSGGTDTACVLKSDGTVWCWGTNDTLQLGNSDATTSDQVVTPVQVQTNDTTPVDGGVTVTPMFLTGVVQLSVGGLHSCALDSGGKVWCWGKNGKQQLGITGSDSPFAVQAMLSGVTGIKKVVAGNAHSCALTIAGNVWCWGANGKDQRGDPAAAASGASQVLATAPVLDDAGVPDGGIPPTTLSGVVDVTTGFDHTCALKSDQTVWCWGLNSKGQLGAGDIANHQTAVEVLSSDGTALGSAVSIATGEMHTCAAKMDGTVWCWGDNGQNFGGQLGNNTKTSSLVPVQVLAAGSPPAPLSGATSVVAGHRHSCALIGASRQMYCWGVNGKNQIGVPGRDVHVATLAPACQ